MVVVVRDAQPDTPAQKVTVAMNAALPFMAPLIGGWWRPGKVLRGEHGGHRPSRLTYPWRVFILQQTQIPLGGKEKTMSGQELAVLGGGLAAVAWVNWYFFLAKGPAAVARAGAGGVQEVTIAVRGGYEPAVVKVRKGAPVRLTFDRQETSGCSEEVVFPDFGVRKFLPAFEKTVVEIVPAEAGAFGFTCGMSMLQGRLEVE